MRLDRGILAAVAAATLFGVSTPLAKALVTDRSPLLLAGLLYLGSGAGLGLVLLVRSVRGAREPIRWPVGADVGWLVAAIACGGVIGPFLLMTGLARTDAASATLTLNFESVFTALLAWFAFSENFDRRIAAGMALICAGGIVLSATAPPAHASGMLLIAGACLAWALDNNLTRKVSGSDALVVACSKGLLAGTTSVGLALASGAMMPGPGIVVRAALLGFVGYGVSLTLFVIALRQLGAARTGAYFALSPFIGALLALALGAPATLSLALAGLLMGTGIWLHLTERHEHEHRHEPLTHAHPHVHDAHHQHAHDGPVDETVAHSHMHSHEALTHSHPHYPDLHHHQHEH